MCLDIQTPPVQTCTLKEAPFLDIFKQDFGTGTQYTKSTNQQYLDFVKNGLPNKNIHPVDQIFASLLIKYFFPY